MRTRFFSSSSGTVLSSCAALLFSLLILYSDPDHLYGQSCPVGCPIYNNCAIQTGPGCVPPDPYAGGDHGSDPFCTYTDPNPCRFPVNGCNASSSPDGYGCCVHISSPIILDLQGEGFHLSDASGGVWFKAFLSTNQQYMIAWPVRGSHNGWLVLDRNGDGIINDLSEFFGNETPQPAPVDGKQLNGFSALAVHDTPAQGGNGDGWISKEDAIYSRLRVWVDENHDGISQSSELHTLKSLKIEAISLKYEESKRKDSNGNLFRYRSVIRDDSGGETSKVIYDVFLQVGSERNPPIPSTWAQPLAPVSFGESGLTSKQSAP
jgi:hypothetical protein